MKFGTKFLTAGGEGGVSQTNPGEAGQEKKQPTIDDLVTMISSLTETVKNTLTVTDELKKKFETKPEDVKNSDVKNTQPTDGAVTKDYIDNLIKSMTETVAKTTSDVVTGALKQRDDVAKIQDFLDNVPEENKKVATALVNANAGKKPIDDIFKEIEGLGLTIPATNGYSTTIPKGMTVEQHLATTDLAKELGLTEDDYKGTFLSNIPALIKAAKYHGTKVFTDFLKGGKK